MALQYGVQNSFESSIAITAMSGSSGTLPGVEDFISIQRGVTVQTKTREKTIAMRQFTAIQLALAIADSAVGTGRTARIDVPFSLETSLKWP